MAESLLVARESFACTYEDREIVVRVLVDGGEVAYAELLGAARA